MPKKQEWIITVKVRFDEPVGAEEFGYALRKIGHGIEMQHGNGISDPESDAGVEAIMITAETGEGMKIGAGVGQAESVESLEGQLSNYDNQEGLGDGEPYEG